MPKPQGFCIFCGGPGLDHEHVIANWTARYLKKNIPEHGKLSLQIDNPGLLGRETVASTIKKIDGDPRSRRVRRVCKKCNRGWMRDWQNLAKPIAERIIQGHAVTLSASDQKVLSMWVLMTVIVSEWSDPEYQAVPEGDRRFMWSMQSPPAHWKIFLGLHPEGVKDPYLHHESAAFPNGSGDNDALNTQATSYTVGNLYVHAVSSTIPAVVDGFKINLWGCPRLVQLWPIINAPQGWPPLVSLSRNDAERIAWAMYDYIGEVNRRNGAAP